jgi:hypothetical protein
MRLRYGRFLLFTACAALAANRTPTEESEAVFQQLRSRTADHLAQLPHYTCHEVINRMLRHGSTWNRVDQVELEVAVIGREELFARPGENRFEERSIDRLVPNGTVGNGAFGTHVDALFLEDSAAFSFAGTGKKDGHKTVRYDFSVPLEKSKFLVKHSGIQGIVPYEGSVWFDSETLDLVRVDLNVKHIDPRIGVRAIQEIMHYKTMQIGNSKVVLPHKSELGATDTAGNYSLNLVELQSCREYQSDSIVKYGAPAEGSAAREQPEQ